MEQRGSGSSISASSGDASCSTCLPLFQGKNQLCCCFLHLFLWCVLRKIIIFHENELYTEYSAEYWLTTPKPPFSIKSIWLVCSIKLKHLLCGLHQRAVGERPSEPGADCSWGIHLPECIYLFSCQIVSTALSSACKAANWMWRQFHLRAQQCWVFMSVYECGFLKTFLCCGQWGFYSCCCVFTATLVSDSNIV